MISICATLFINPNIDDQVMGRYEQVSLFLFATYCCVMIIICAKLFLNPSIRNKVMGRTRTGFTDVYAQSVSADSDLDF